MLRNEEDARDAVQEAFLSAFKALAGFDGHCQLVTWLHRIAVNAALMKLRRARRRPESPIEELLPDFDETGHHLCSIEPWRPEPLAELEPEEVRSSVRAAIDQLPDSYRTVLLLRDIEEMSTEDRPGPGSERERGEGAAPPRPPGPSHRARPHLPVVAGRDP